MKLWRNQMKLRKNRMKLRKNLPVSSEEFFNFLGGSVLFLKKVHSWEGVTEMVHGSFLLVL